MKGKGSAAQIALTALVLAVLSLPAGAEPKRCDASPEANRQIVLAFYNTALVGLDPRAGFERYMSSDFIEHKPDVPEGTRTAVAEYLQNLIKSMPRPRWEVLRTVAEGDLVFLHARFSPALNAPSYAIADLFRLNCRIVEHWDVVSGPPERLLNPNSRF